VVAEQTFSVSRPAGENRISAIVAAYDAATRDVNSQIVAWIEANAGRA
jgi:cholesterol transport system auxiliary component